MATVAVTLELIELDETPGLLASEVFEIAVRFSDLLGDQAVFAGYVDIEFEPTQLRVDEILYESAFYPAAQTGEIDNDLGLVDEVGAVDGISPPPDDSVDRIVFRLRMTALVDLRDAVTTTIATNAPEASGSEIVIFGSDGDFRDDTDYGSLLLAFSDDSPFFTADSFSFDLVTAEDPIGTATASDPNGDNLFFAILEGNDPDSNGVGAFEIDNNGQITVANADELTGTDLFNLTVAVSDLESELPDNPDDTASVAIGTSEDPPSFTADSFSFELVTVEDPIGTATVSNPNGDNLFFAILEGNDPDGNGIGAFAIDNNGQITIANADELTGTDTFELTVGVSDLESELPDNPDDTASVAIVTDSTSFSLDVDGSSEATAFNDGLIIFRFLGGLAPETFESALSPDASRNVGEIAALLESSDTQLDADGDGAATAFNDGLIIFRFLGGLAAETFESALSPDASRSPEAIATFLNSLMPENI